MDTTSIVKSAALTGLCCGVVVMAVTLAYLFAIASIHATDLAEVAGPALPFGFSVS